MKKRVKKYNPNSSTFFRVLNMLFLTFRFENAETDFKFEVPIPDPVFFCSAEPPSLAKAAQLETAILELQREDPSLHVRIDEETGQTILGGTFANRYCNPI